MPGMRQACEGISGALERRGGLGRQDSVCLRHQDEEPIIWECRGKIERKLKDLGLTIAKNNEPTIVQGRAGPLEESAEETLKQIDADLAKML
jgi:hypothetical protein